MSKRRAFLYPGATSKFNVFSVYIFTNLAKCTFFNPYIFEIGKFKQSVNINLNNILPHCE